MSDLDLSARLPALRSELKILPGIREVNGLKSWLIFDPLRHQYFQIDDKNHQLLVRWQSGSAEQIIADISQYQLSAEDIESLLRFLWSNSLTLSPPGGDNGFYVNHKSQKKSHWIVRLLHGYLFIVLPLFRPAAFLARTEPLTRMFFSRAWWSFILVLGLLGIYLTSRQWDQFIHTFNHFFSLNGLLYYAAALCFVKLAHEAGHAYAATRYGCTVKSMGVAFIVMFPVLYTDNTDSWKLTSRRKRLIISAAGVAVELSLAVIATAVWAFATDGPLRSAAFFVATTSWVMTVLINMNPLMRFDAYHFLSDALGVQNLQARAFAIGKWSMREILFKLREPQPEAMSRSWIRGLTLFAWATWIYRFFLFLGIALLVHALFFKPFGSFLAIVEILFFIAIPIMNELKEWYKRKYNIAKSPASWLTMACSIAFIVALVTPWQNTVRIPAVLEPAESTVLYAPASARLVTLHVNQGDAVEKGQLLVSMESEEIQSRKTLIEREISLRTALLNRIASDELNLDQKVVLESELNSFKEELAGLDTTLNQLVLPAPFTGVIGNLDSSLHTDRWIGEGQALLTLTSLDGARVRGFVERNNLGRIEHGTDAVFIPDIPELEKLSGKVQLLNSANAEEINIAALASTYGGKIAVASGSETMQPLKSWYHVSVELPDYQQPVLQQQRGLVLAQGTPESIAVRVWRRAVQVILREVLI